VAHRLGQELAAAGLVVVSGMAYGVDAAAHRGALDGGGLTAAVLGGGADNPYPVGERVLHGRIVQKGLTLSEMPPRFRPFRWSFPSRNRIIAALSAMTVVVQARGRSGALITARMAAEDLGREVGAVPGPVNSALSRGCNDLLADGAAIVRSARDVVDLLVGVGAIDEAGVRRVGSPPPVDPELAAALGAVDAGAATADEVAARLSLPAGETAVALARLELLGHVRADALGRYSRTPNVSF
jgi:DNA processing protein